MASEISTPVNDFKPAASSLRNQRPVPHPNSTTSLAEKLFIIGANNLSSSARIGFGVSS
jgi:hypothetical protein